MAKRFLIISDTYGSGDEELGRVLMRNFLYSLARAAEKPAAVMLANGGVRLACEGAESLDELRLLAEHGVAIKACGTCVDYLKLTDKLAVGEVGNMQGAVDAMLGQDDVVTIA